MLLIFPLGKATKQNSLFISPHGKALAMRKNIAKLILEVMAFRVLSSQVLVTGVISRDRHIAAKILYGLSGWIGPKFAKPPDKLQRDIANQIVALFTSEVPIRRVTHSEFISNDVPNDGLRVFADQLLDGAAGRWFVPCSQERQQYCIALLLWF